MKVVVDASIVLAIFLKEPRVEHAVGRIKGALCSTVNLTEILTRCADGNVPARAAFDFLGSHGITFADYDEDLALAASKLRPATRHKGLSLGDRACLALAIREGATAITTDRAWADLDVGCHIEVIR